MEHPKLTPNALTVLSKRYFLKNSKGETIEDVDKMFGRVAGAVSNAERVLFPDGNCAESMKIAFFDMLRNLEFLPNSPTLMNAGRKNGQLSGCFVLPIGDSMEEIFEAVKQAALVHKSGGGTGFSFSSLRPANDVVRSTSGVSSGPVSFMSVFNSATEAIKQGGTRRGANMGCLRVDHPDIKAFITCKSEQGAFNNFNISVLLTEQFMEAVAKGNKYPLRNPRNGQVVVYEDAKEVFDLIVQMAWKNGEPGIIFIDRINECNQTPNIGKIESTNPCGEQPLLPYESCNLGSINLSRMLTPDKELDWTKLQETTKKAVRFLDDVVTVNQYPAPEIDAATKANRKIGLGVMGFADMLIDLGIPYNSDAAVQLGEKIMLEIELVGREESVALGHSRGSFPNFEGSDWQTRIGLDAMRNATVTTIAPTGTLSIIAGCSSGIEPLFALAYSRNVGSTLGSDLQVDVHPAFATIAKERGFYSQELMQKIAEKGSCQGMSEVPEDVQRVFITSMDIDPEWHVKMQAAFQKHTDNAVSKTVNMPEASTQTDIEAIYKLAYELGCKGITVYRYGSRDVQVLNIGCGGKNKIEEVAPRVRPVVTSGTTERIRTGCGNMYVTINEDDQGLCEIFTRLGKAGGCASSQLEAIGRLVSLSLRAGVDVADIKKHLRGIRCPELGWDQCGQVQSCADAIGIAIEHHLDRKNGTTTTVPTKTISDIVVCPDCGSYIEHAAGCATCRVCGWSKCG
jgi:ribonucleoside-diphosphate reductase alpha chain